MAAGDYAHKPGGSLKFKGGEGSKKKKKKSKSSSTAVKVREEASDEGGAAGKEAAKPRDQPELDDDGDEHDAGHSAAKIKSKSSGMTESEQRYEAIRKQRLAEKVRKEAKKSHKERVAEFNDKLEGMSEHYDLPRIGPG